VWASSRLQLSDEAGAVQYEPDSVAFKVSRVLQRCYWPDACAQFLAGSTSSSLCEHWVSRLPGSKQPSIASAASSRRTSLASLSESVELTGERSEDDGVYQRCRAWGILGHESFCYRIPTKIAANYVVTRDSYSSSWGEAGTVSTGADGFWHGCCRLLPGR